MTSTARRVRFAFLSVGLIMVAACAGQKAPAQKLLADIDMDFIKIDGSLMQGLSTNQLQQQRVKGLVEASKRRGIETVAERVEDANTMAVLWQLGVEFIQGYFVNAPEDVTMSGER